MALVRSHPAIRTSLGGRFLALVILAYPRHLIRAHQIQDAHAAGQGHITETGEFSTFEAYFQQYTAEIVGYLWRLTCNEQVAQDLAQETFLRAWRRFDELREYQQPRAWLFRVATNLALNHLRQQTRWRKRLLPDYFYRESSASEATQAAQAAQELLPNLPLVGDHATEVVEREAIRATLLALPPIYRAALVLRSVYGMEYSEIGAALDMSPGAARTTLCRSRERFRALYTQEQQPEKKSEGQP